ncbi:MAG: proton-conducting transporter membrane subunit [Acidaminococcaceae bacterium]
MTDYIPAFFAIAIFCYILGCFAVLIPRKHQLFAHYFAQVMSILGSTLILITAGIYLLSGETALLKVAFVGRYMLAIDAWSSVFLCITGLAGVLTSIFAVDYALAYIGKRLRELSGLWNLFLLSMVLVLVAQSAVSFLVSWEVMAIVSFLLVNHDSEKRETWQAAYQYLVMTHIGTAAIMIAFFIVGSGSNGLNFSELNNAQLETTARNLAFTAAFLGFALKAGLVPLHVWLPNAHPAAPSHVSALMSGVMLKVAVYGFGRFIFDFLGPVDFWWGALVLVVGLLSAFFGALYAQMEKDIKRILAYSSVENMGIVFAAIGAGMLLLTTSHKEYAVIGFTAAIVHSFNHSIMKSLMFMVAGAVNHAVDDKNIEKMGGLAKLMPWTAGCALTGSLALAALPLTNGFIGEWLMFHSFAFLAQADAGTGVRLLAALAFILSGLASALALGCFVRVFGVVFLGRPRARRAESAHEVSRFMLAAMLIPALLIFVSGILASPIVTMAQHVAEANLPDLNMLNEENLLIWGKDSGLLNYDTFVLLIATVVITIFAWLIIYRGQVFVKRDVIWNCGTEPTLRQQYSGTGFSKPIRRAFDFLLKPRREVVFLQKENKYFGRSMAYTLTIPDRFTEKLYIPLQHHLVKTASFLRRIQAGSVRIYIGYVMVAMVLVLIWGAM